MEDNGESVATNSDPVGKFFELENETMRNLKNKTGHCTQLGDWAHLMYKKVEPLVEIERGINDLDGLDSVICCYRIEGFSSINLRHVAQLVELHSRIVFRSFVPVTPPRTAVYTSN